MDDAEDESVSDARIGITRRRALGTLTLGASAALATTGGMAGEERNKPGPEPAEGGRGVAPGRHAMVPLPFDPKSLRGLSERLIVSHWENNYGGALKNLNKVEEDLAGVSRDTAGYLVSGLKERELVFTNSVILHEQYFANLGGDGRPGGVIQKAIADGFGGFGRWEELFRATGSSLGGGSGWAILDFNFHTGDLRTYWSGNHTQALAFGRPILVLDMYEHAYQMDYGAAAARYIDAFFQNIRWDEVGRRYEAALAAAKAMHG